MCECILSSALESEEEEETNILLLLLFASCERRGVRGRVSGRMHAKIAKP